MQKIALQALPTLSLHDVRTEILRLDQIHPIVSGNKWFKLKYYLRDAQDQGCKIIVTCGGAYSNHLVATAYAASAAGLKSIGYVRGGEPAHFSPTLLDAQSFGMELRFVSREQYRDKNALAEADSAQYWIGEGGYGLKGAAGAAEIPGLVSKESYSHILCAVGTGTMMAGLIKAAGAGQQIVGISVLKNHGVLEQEVKALLDPDESGRSFEILHDYHFGGYAKHPPALLQFMKELWKAESLPTDIVYTSKLLFAAQDLVNKKHFPAGSRLLLIHSGGLQGNRSLPAQALPF
ncbi:MAG: pyridoxal-phosphate dependent enzyme [Chitinophagaceae bacterium]|nr:pyridoxal-phosphate dependent enzyme [Chitinophagaceae bacterium]